MIVHEKKHTKPYQISILYLQLSITAILINNATLMSCHFRKMAISSPKKQWCLRICHYGYLYLPSHLSAVIPICHHAY